MITLLDMMAVMLWSSENSAVNREAQARLDAAKDAERAARQKARDDDQARAREEKKRAHFLIDCPRFSDPTRAASFIFRESDFQAWRIIQTNKHL